VLWVFVQAGSLHYDMMQAGSLHYGRGGTYYGMLTALSLYCQRSILRKMLSQSD
jgi:hypothetical protein